MSSPLLAVPARVYLSKAQPQMNAQMVYGSFLSHNKAGLA